MNPLVLLLCSETVVLVIQRASEIPAPVIYRGFWYWRRNGVKAFEGTLFNQGSPGTHTHTRLTTLCSGLPRWAGTRKVEPIWILLKEETVSGSGISWAICKSVPRPRQITTPAPHHSVFFTGRMPFLPPNQQHQSTEGMRLVRKKWIKTDKWGSIRYKQENNISCVPKNAHL